MARRKKSYRANQNNLVGTFINNRIVDSKKAAKERERESQKRAKAEEKRLKAEAKAEEKRLKAEAKAEEKRLKDEKKYLDLIKDYAKRLNGEFESINIFCSEELLYEVAVKCKESGFTPAKAYKNYALPRIDVIRKRGLELFFENNLPNGYSSCRSFDTLQSKIESLTDTEAIVPDLVDLVLSTSEFAECDSEAKIREESRCAVLKDAELKLFEEDFNLLVEIANADYLSGEEIEKTEEYVNGVSLKLDYKNQIDENLKKLTTLTIRDLCNLN